MTFSEVCKKARPRAAPMAILSLNSQDNGSIFGFPAQPNYKPSNEHEYIHPHGGYLF